MKDGNRQNSGEQVSGGILDGRVLMAENSCQDVAYPKSKWNCLPKYTLSS
jgi:hypothetical protein